MSDVAVAENEAPEEVQQMAEATQAPPRRPHRATRPQAAQPAANAPARPARPATAPAGPSLPPKRGFIRLLCVKDYTHGQRIQLTRKTLQELDGMSDLDPKDIKAAVTRYEAGKQYYLPSDQAARLLRDKGPARFKNPLTERVERRKEVDIFFRAVDRAELEAWLDNELDKIEERREAVLDAEVNDQNAADEDEGDE